MSLTTQNLIDLYNVLADKYGSPNQIDSEILGNLNYAHYEYLNRLSPDNEGGVINFEFDQNVATNIKPLVYNITLNMDVNGLISESAINTALQTASSDPTAKVFRYMAVGVSVSGTKYPVKYEPHNSRLVNERNFFKRPTTTNSKYTMLSEGLEFYPTQQSSPVTLTVIKTPRPLSLSPLVNPELPDIALYNIVAIALKLFGIQVREGELLEDARLSGLQITQ